MWRHRAFIYQTLAFWVYTPCNIRGINRRFGGTYCLHRTKETLWKVRITTVKKPTRNTSSPGHMSEKVNYSTIQNTWSKQTLQTWFRDIKDKKLQEPFVKFVASPYYSESELRGGPVTVSVFELPPLASDALLTTPHPLLENVLQTVCHKLQEDSGTGGFDLWAPFSLLEKPRNRMGRGLECMADVLMGFYRSQWAHPLPLLNRATLTLH
jgi:hypothetical protein